MTRLVIWRGREPAGVSSRFPRKLSSRPLQEASAPATRYTGRVPPLRPELQEIVEELLRQSGPASQISLDSIGEAIGARAVSYVEVDAMIQALEDGGCVVESGEQPRGEHHLRAVVVSIRELKTQLGRRPTQSEIAEHAGLTSAQVRHALLLVRIMQR